MFKNICKLLHINKIQTTAYHPESNGALKRSHRTLTEYLHHYINADQIDSDEWIPYAIFIYNTTPHTATGYIRFELVYGHQARKTIIYIWWLRARTKRKITNRKSNCQRKPKKWKIKAKEYHKKTKTVNFKIAIKCFSTMKRLGEDDLRNQTPYGSNDNKKKV